MKLKRLLLALLLIAACGGTIYLLAIKKNGGAEQPKEVTLATFSKALGNSPYHIAKHFKWFEEDPRLQGVNVVYKEYNDRPTISDALSGGELQVLFSAEVPSILCRAQGNDTRIVAVSATVSQDILVQKDGPIRTVPELRGKKLAVLQGTSSQFCLLKILKANGMSEKDVDLRYISPAEAKVQFEQGKLDGWAVWAPFVEQQEVAGRGRSVPGGVATINSVMTVSTPFLLKHEPAAQAVADAVLRAKKWIVANPEEAQRIIAQELGLDPAVVKAAWLKHNWAATLDEKLIDDIQEKATFLADADLTRKSKKLDVRTELINLRLLSGTE